MSHWPAVAAVAVAAVAARAPFLGVGLVPDEGGYAHVASAWADGGRLYHDAWVDRPQGLVLTYRLLLGLHEGPLAVRLGAVAAATAVTLLLLAVGWLAHSRAAGIWAAGLYAVVGAAPRIEGYTLHAELAAAVPATAAVAFAPVAVLFAQLAVAAPAERTAVIPSASPAERDQRVARHLERLTTSDERIYVLVSRPNVYFAADRRSPTPYLWHPPLRLIPGAMRHLERALAAPRSPAYVVVYQPVARVDPTGRLARILAARYVADRRAPPGLPPIMARSDRRATTTTPGLHESCRCAGLSLTRR